MVFGGLANKTAAMPSLHCGFTFLIAFYGISRLHGWWRWLLLLYPVAMSLTLVYSAEHYLIDAIMGGVIAAAGDGDRRLVGPAGGRPSQLALIQSVHWCLAPRKSSAGSGTRRTARRSPVFIVETDDPHGAGLEAARALLHDVLEPLEVVALVVDHPGIGHAAALGRVAPLRRRLLPPLRDLGEPVVAPELHEVAVLRALARRVGVDEHRDVAGREVEDPGVAGERHPDDELPGGVLDRHGADVQLGVAARRRTRR